MNNPCLTWPHTQSGLSIEESDDALFMVFKSELMQPLKLPDARVLNICVAKNISAHFLMSDAQINLVLEPGAHVYCYSLSNKNLELFARVYDEASLSIAHMNLNSLKNQSVINIELLAPHAQVSFLGLDNLLSSQTSSTLLHIDHKTHSTKSTQAFRGIYAGESLGFFKGKVTIAAHAESSSAKQLYKSILLGKRARAYVKPELEINNFNITASHGASIGQLDPEALFYLSSRGLDKGAAEKILVKCLSEDILQEVHPAMREYLAYEVELSLGAMHEEL